MACHTTLQKVADLITAGVMLLIRRRAFQHFTVCSNGVNKAVNYASVPYLIPLLQRISSFRFNRGVKFYYIRFVAIDNQMKLNIRTNWKWHPIFTQRIVGGRSEERGEYRTVFVLTRW